MAVFQAAVVLMPHPNGGWVAFKHEEGWNLPGGKVEKGETPRFAALRECIEEVGITPTSLRLVTLFRGFYGGVEWDIHVFFAPMPLKGDLPTTEDGQVLKEGALHEQLAAGRFPDSVGKIFARTWHCFVGEILQSKEYQLWRERTTYLGIQRASELQDEG